MAFLRLWHRLRISTTTTQLHVVGIDIEIRVGLAVLASTPADGKTASNNNLFATQQVWVYLHCVTQHVIPGGVRSLSLALCACQGELHLLALTNLDELSITAYVAFENDLLHSVI